MAFVYLWCAVNGIKKNKKEKISIGWMINRATIFVKCRKLWIVMQTMKKKSWNKHLSIKDKCRNIIDINFNIVIRKKSRETFFML